MPPLCASLLAHPMKPSCSIEQSVKCLVICLFVIVVDRHHLQCYASLVSTIRYKMTRCHLTLLLVSMSVTLDVTKAETNKIELLLCRGHIELRLWLRLI